LGDKVKEGVADCFHFFFFSPPKLFLVLGIGFQASDTSHLAPLTFLRLYFSFLEGENKKNLPQTFFFSAHFVPVIVSPHFC